MKSGAPKASVDESLKGRRVAKRFPGCVSHLLTFQEKSTADFVGEVSFQLCGMSIIDLCSCLSAPLPSEMIFYLFILSDMMYLLIRMSTPPNNRQLNILIGTSEKKQIDDYVEELTF